jgi:tetratricopeptide (TPR) repeat protein
VGDPSAPGGAARLTKSAASVERRPFDPLLPLSVLVGVGVLWWTSHLYRPVPPVFFPRQATEFQSSADLDAAQATADALLEKNPVDIDALVQKTLVSFQRGRDYYKDALKTLEKARELGALDERLFYYAGVMYEAENLPDFAVTDFERYLNRHPDDLEIQLRLGNLYYRLEDLDKSIDAYRKVLAKQPDDALVSFNLAFVLRDRKNWTEALDALKPFTDGGRSMPTGGHKLLGDIRRGLGDPRQALEEYKIELATSGDSADLAAAMAASEEEVGDTGSAIDRWKQVLRLDPKNSEAKRRLRALNRALKSRRVR